MENYTQALNCFDQVLRLKPADIYALVDKGFALHYLGRLEEAIEIYTLVLNKLPNDIEILRKRGKAYRALVQLNEAFTDFNQVLQQNPNDLAALDGVGNIYFRWSQYDRALQIFDRFLTNLPNTPEILLLKAHSLRHLKRFKEAIEVYDNSIHAFQEQRGSVGFYDPVFLKGLYKCWDGLLEDDPNNLKYLLGKADALAMFEKEDSGPKAIDLFDHITNLYPDNLEAWLQKGNYLIFIGSLEEAKKCIEAVKQIDPNNHELEEKLAKREEMFGKINDLSKGFEKIIEKIDTESQTPTWTQDKTLPVCLQCGYTLQKDWNMCPICQTPFSHEDEPLIAWEPDEDLLECPNCGYTLQDDWNECPICNTPIKKE